MLSLVSSQLPVQALVGALGYGSALQDSWETRRVMIIISTIFIIIIMIMAIITIMNSSSSSRSNN